MRSAVPFASVFENIRLTKFAKNCNFAFSYVDPIDHVDEQIVALAGLIARANGNVGPIVNIGQIGQQGDFVLCETFHVSDYLRIRSGQIIRAEDFQAERADRAVEKLLDRETQQEYIL